MGQGNYSNAVNTAIQGANLPKSALSQEMSMFADGSMGNQNGFNSVLSQLGQIGNMNAFPGYNAGAGTPGQMIGQAQSPVQYMQDKIPNIPLDNTNFPVNPPASGPSNTGGAGPTNNPQNTVPNDASSPSSGLPGGRISAQGTSPSFNFSLGNTPTLAQQQVTSQSQPFNAPPPSGANFTNFIANPSTPSSRPRPDLPAPIPGQGTTLSPIPLSQNGIAPIQQASPNLTGLNSQQMNNQALSTLLQQLQAPGVSNYNPSASLLSNPALNQQFSGLQGLGIQGLSSALAGQLSQAQQPFNPQQVSINNLGNGQVSGLPSAQSQNVQAGNFNPQQAQLASLQQQYDPTQDPYYQAVQQSLQNQQTLDQKNLQAQFSASGGTGRGTPAAFAQAQLMAQQSPQMAAALGQVAQQEQANQLQRQQLVQSGALQNADMANQYGLAGNQLQAQTGLANIANQLQAAGLNQNALLQNQSLGNQFGLAQQGNSLQAQQANQQAGLQAAGLGNQQLGTLGGLLNSNQQLGLQNYLGTIGANQQQQSLLAQLANQAGGQNLQQNQLGSQNIFNAAQLNSQNANNALQNQLGFQTNQNQAILGQNNLLSQLGQFNAGQANQLNQQYSQQAQTANQNQINNQMTALQNLAQIYSQFGLSGIPGGSANVNLGAQSQNMLQSLAGIL